MTSSSSFAVKVASVCLGSAMLLLTGCSMNTGVLPPSANSAASVTIHGSTFGGQQAISGAHIFLLAAGTTGYGAAATSLLTSGTVDTTVGSPTNGFYYVKSATDGYGSFSVTGDYTCTQGQYLYLYATGGDSVDGNSTANPNTNIGLLAGLGECSTISSATTVTINEVSTIVTAYALAGYAKSPVQIGYPATVSVGGVPSADSMATTGFQNAFANIANIMSVSTGTVYTHPVSTATAYVGADKINLLANVLASCVNGLTTSTVCTTLFSNETSNGLAVGTAGSVAPKDTAFAAIYMAKNQWNSPTAIYGGVSGTSPFPSSQSSATDLTFAVSYPFGGSGGSGIAADASGNVWAGCSGCTTLTKFTPNGTTTILTGNGMGNVQGEAIDGSGNAWVVDAGTTNKLSVFTNSGAAVTGSPFSPMNGTTAALNKPYPPAFDASGNLWVPNNGGGNVVKVSGAGAYVTTITPTIAITAPKITAVSGSGDLWVSTAATANPIFYFPGATGTGETNPTISNCGTINGEGLATDVNNNAWVSCAGGVVEITPTGTVNSYLSSTGGGGSLTIDSGGNIFQAMDNNNVPGINQYTTSGTLISPTGGYNLTTGAGIPATTGGGYLAASNVDFVTMDISGNVWATGPKYVYQIFGLGNPTVEPLAPGSLTAAP